MTALADFDLDPGALQPKWGWFVALGVVLLALGGLALVDTVSVTLFSVIFIGAALLVGGVFQIIHAFANRDWGSFLFALLCGALYIVGGLLIMDEPVRGSLVITILLAIALAVSGVTRMVMAVRHRNNRGWWLILLAGLGSILIALILLLSLPWSSLWLLGTLIAIELIFHGVGWIFFGFALRRMR